MAVDLFCVFSSSYCILGNRHLHNGLVSQHRYSIKSNRRRIRTATKYNNSARIKHDDILTALRVDMGTILADPSTTEKQISWRKIGELVTRAPL